MKFYVICINTTSLDTLVKYRAVAMRFEVVRLQQGVTLPKGAA